MFKFSLCTMIIGDYMYFKRIGDLRIDNDLTQNKMADILNVSRNTYSKWELGYNNIPLEMLDKFASYFNVSIDYITALTDKKSICTSSPYNKEILRQRLIEIRKEKTVSQQELCLTLNFKQTTYSGYENGHATIPFDKLYLFAKNFNVSIDYLMGRSNKKTI